MLTLPLDLAIANDIIESLRSGIPPKRFVSLYSVGSAPFLRDVRQQQLERLSSRGRIRFVCGHWGSGKTHMLRLLREEALDAGYLVSSVELTADQTPFHKFEQVFFEIVRNIIAPRMFYENDAHWTVPFGEVLRRAVALDAAQASEAVLAAAVQAAKSGLYAHDGIDTDFRRMVAAYWDTILPDAGDLMTLADRRAHLLQWFTGEGGLSEYRSLFGVHKMVDRTNARLMLQSLARFARHIGYEGLVVLLDEAEMAYSVMRKANLKQAHNNLLHLINSIDECEGAFLVYAATPDFFIDDRYGIVNYGALAQRIGRPEPRPPSALDRIWNLDALQLSTEDYAAAASKIREVYLVAVPAARDRIVPEDDLHDYVTELVELHPEFSYISTWRVVVTGTVQALDRSAGGEPLMPARSSYTDVLARLREGS